MPYIVSAIMLMFGVYLIILLCLGVYIKLTGQEDEFKEWRKWYE